MLGELLRLQPLNKEEINVVLLGGRGGQNFHRLLSSLADNSEYIPLFSRLNLFMQDALSPLSETSPLSFEASFRANLGAQLLDRIRGFYPIDSNPADIRDSLSGYVQLLTNKGGIDLMFAGHGPEPNNASHLAYIRPQSGATIADAAGILPASENLLEHHISKFKAGGTQVTAAQEAECRRASIIQTLGPAPILAAKRLVQVIVDADTSPAKKQTFRWLMLSTFSDNLQERAKQVDENPGLWVRMHPNIVTLVTPTILEM
jgi:hypothetical protein